MYVHHMFIEVTMSWCHDEDHYHCQMGGLASPVSVVISSTLTTTSHY